MFRSQLFVVMCKGVPYARCARQPLSQLGLKCIRFCSPHMLEPATHAAEGTEATAGSELSNRVDPGARRQGVCYGEAFPPMHQLVLQFLVMGVFYFFLTPHDTLK